MTIINKNTYYKLPIWFITLCMTKKYNKISKKDNNNKNYFIISICGINKKVSFKNIFGTNSKIKGIKSIDFNNASFCTSYNMGYCQINHQKYCYAYVFERQYKNSKNNYYFKFNSFLKGYLMLEITRQLYKNNKLYNHFIKYINDNIKYLRFNVNSDFNNTNDFKLIKDIALKTNTIIYGYTARDDLMDDYKPLKIKNLTVNGSNNKYDNKYNATFNLKEYFKASHKCHGSCLECGKCFKLKNKVITTLFHHSNSDSILNTYINRLFIIDLMDAFNITITHKDLKRYKGLFKSLNQFLIDNNGLNLNTYDINGLKDLMDALDGLHYDIMDNIDLYDEIKLKEIGVI